MKTMMMFLGLTLVGCATTATIPEDEPTTTTACAGLTVGSSEEEPGTCTGAFVLGTFSPEMDGSIRSAGKAWNDLANRGLVHFTENVPCKIVSGTLPRGVYGRHTGGTITLDTVQLASSNSDHVHFVVTHEMGIALGLSVLEESTGVMASCSSEPYFSKADLVECVRTGLCSTVTR